MALSRADVDIRPCAWTQPAQIAALTYICGYCGDKVSSIVGYYAINAQGAVNKSTIRICPSCTGPTLFTDNGKRMPANAPGEAVPNVPPLLTSLYEEARSCAAAGAYTGSVLLCRKLLMNIAVEEGAKEGQTFVKYVEYLADKGFVPPNGRGWVDYVRTRGNEATHEIALMSEQDATALITFIEMLLRFIYEFPKMVPPIPSSVVSVP